MPYAVSEQMVETYGDLIFDLSLNKQIRRGDPIRQLDHAAWLREREATGLTDPEIAHKTGLAIEQVTFIRNIVERRRFRLDQYRKLFRLGGGLRYREDRYRDPEEKFEMSDAAVALRRSMHFNAREVAKYVQNGWWTGRTVWDWINEMTRADPDLAVDGKGAHSIGDLKNSAAAVASALASNNVHPGDVVAAVLPDGFARYAAYLGAAKLGCVFLPLSVELAGLEISGILSHARARAVIGDGGAMANLMTEMVGLAGESADLDVVFALEQKIAGAVPLDLQDPATEELQSAYEPAAADPVLLLAAAGGESVKLAIHTHQTFLNALGATAVGVHIPPLHDTSAAEAETFLMLTAGAGISSIPGLEMRIVGDDGTEASAGETGHLQVRGPSLFAGYLKNPGAEKEAWTADGWFRTGRRATLERNESGVVTAVVGESA